MSRAATPLLRRAAVALFFMLLCAGMAGEKPVQDDILDITVRVVIIRTADGSPVGSGSGTVVGRRTGSSGAPLIQVLTAAHVINHLLDGQMIVLEGEGWQTYAWVARVSKVSDLALLEGIAAGYPFGGIALVAPESPPLGSEVIGAGDPYGSGLRLSYGHVVSRSRQWGIEIHVLPGMSGGGVFYGGRLIGVIVMVMRQPGGMGALQAHIIGIVPLDEVVAFLREVDGG